MRLVVRRVLPLLAIAAITIAASCEPLKHPIKDTPPGANIASYFVGETTGVFFQNVTRSATPFQAPVCDDPGEAGVPVGGPGSHLVSGPPSTAEASQALNDDGSVTLGIVVPTGSRCGAATGFAVVVGPLGDLHTNTIGTTPGSDAVVSQLALDGDGDGDFGESGTDAICEPGAGGSVIREVGVAVVDDTTLFTCANALGEVPGQPTLQSLKDGFSDLGGIDASTPVAFQVALRNRSTAAPPAVLAEDGNVNATVDSLTINGVEQL